MNNLINKSLHNLISDFASKISKDEFDEILTKHTCELQKKLNEYNRQRGGCLRYSVDTIEYYNFIPYILENLKITTDKS